MKNIKAVSARRLADKRRLRHWTPAFAGMTLGLMMCAGFARAGDLVLHVATQDHPHVRALEDGRVKVQGCELHFSTQSVQVLNADLIGKKQWDVLEVEILPFMVWKSTGLLTDYTLIPVFPSRRFNLRTLYVKKGSGIVTPEELHGKAIGIESHSDTTLLWVQGILQSSWSIKPQEIIWKEAKPEILEQWLLDGHVDAIITKDPPQNFLEDKESKIVRLFPDYEKVESEKFKDTRIFPIMTAIAVRESLIKDNPWLPESLFIAFSEAKKKSMEDLTLPLPWGGEKLEETEKLMGKNYWSYGVKSNPKTLRALFHYAEEQKLLYSPMSIDDVFEPSTLMLLEN